MRKKMIINKPLKEITKTDLQWLIDNQVPEDKTLEYKSELNLSKEKKQKFLEEITAFANADGGDLIYGIKEIDEVPAELVPVIKMSEYDQTVLTITNYLAVWTKPRLSDVSIGKVDLGNEDLALIIRVGRSISAPHAVYDGSTHRFYIRKLNSIIPMDVDELRNSFLKTENFSKRIREFISERLVEIDSNRYDYVNKEYPILVVHAIPVNRFLSRDFYKLKDIDLAVEKSGSNAFHTTNNRRITFDGVRLANTKHKDARTAYAFYFLDGTIEIAGQSGFFFTYKGNDRRIPVGTKIVRSKILCNLIFECFEQINKFYNELNMDQSVLFFMSLLNAKGYRIYTGNLFRGADDDKSIDRDVVLLPEILVEGFSKLDETEIPKTIRPLLDSLWNASGLEKCIFFDDEGNYHVPDDY